MAGYGEVVFPVVITENAPSVVFPVEITQPTPTYDHAVEFPVSLSGALSDASRPRTGQPQIVGWQVLVDGVDMASQLTGSVQVTRSRYALATWSFSLAIGADCPPVMPLQSKLLTTTCGPLGTKPVNVSMVLIAGGTRHVVALITNGICHGTSESYSDGGRIATYSGVGAGGRWDKTVVDYQLSAGTNRYRSSVVRSILAAGEFTGNVTIQTTGRVTKAIEATNQPMVQLVNRVLEPELLRASFDRYGDMVLVPMGRSQYGTFVTLEDQDLLLLQDVQSTFQNDGPTLIVTTTDRQVTESAEDGCSEVTETTKVEVYGNYAPEWARYSQDSAGALTSISGSPAASEILVQRVTTIVTTRCGTEVYREVIEEGYHRGPVSYRYRIDSTGAHTNYRSGVYIYDDGAVKDDESEAYVWNTERFGEIRRTITRHEFDANGYGHRSTTKIHGWRIIEQHLKTRSFSQDWPDVTFDAVTVRGGGEAVPNFNQNHQGAYFGTIGGGWPQGVEQRVVEREITTADDEVGEGFLTSETETVSTWSLKDGSLYLYAGDETYSQSEELFQESGIITRTWQAVGETVTAVETVQDKLTGEVGSKVETAPGFLPAASRLIDPIPGAEHFGEEDDPDLALAALPSESQSIEIERDVFNDPADCRQVGRTEYRVEYAENEEELEAFADHLADQSLVVSVTFALPANPLLDELKALQLVYPPAALNHRVEIVALEWGSSSGRSEVITTVHGEVWP